MRVAAVAAVLCVGAAAVRAQCPDGRQGSSCEAAPRRSVAVLAFKSSDPAQQYFADGISDAITDALAQLPGMKVASRSSAFAFRNSELGAKRIADSLGVATLVEGSVLKSGDRVRVSARLIEASTGYAMWTEQITTAEIDLFELQDTVARAIASRLGETSGKRLVNRATVNAAAQDHYLRGRDFLYRRDAASLRSAIDQFRLAVLADPRHAPAWAGMSQSNALYLPVHMWPTANKATSGDSTYRMAGRALAAANRAIVLDSMLPEAWAVRGYVQVFISGPPAGATRDLRRAIQLRPAYAEAHGWLGQLISFTGGDVREANAEMAKALELDPASIGMRLGQANVLWATRQHERTLEVGRAMAVVRQDLAAITSIFEPAALIALGRAEECLRLPGIPPVRYAACAYAAGRRDEAAARIDSLVQVWETGDTTPYTMYDLIRYYGMTAQVDLFIKWLTTWYERIPAYFHIDDGGLSDPVLKAEGGRARVAMTEIQRKAWDRIVRESRTARLP